MLQHSYARLDELETLQEDESYGLYRPSPESIAVMKLLLPYFGERQPKLYPNAGGLQAEIYNKEIAAEVCVPKSADYVRIEVSGINGASLLEVDEEIMLNYDECWKHLGEIIEKIMERFNDAG